MGQTEEVTFKLKDEQEFVGKEGILPTKQEHSRQRRTACAALRDEFSIVKIVLSKTIYSLSVRTSIYIYLFQPLI